MLSWTKRAVLGLHQPRVKQSFLGAFMHTTWLRRAISLCLMVLGFACDATVGVPGSLDTTFGVGGRARTLNSGDYASALAIQPDGKLVLAGSCFNAAGTKLDFCALRYNSNGTLDGTFGFGGKVVTPLRSGYEYGTALAIQPDGKLVLAGYCPRAAYAHDFCALRYNANGTLDTSFGTGGTVVTSITGFDDRATALVVQPDGKLVLAGFCTLTGFCALRYNGDGALDASFGSGGKVTANVGGFGPRGPAMLLQSDGKVVITGDCLGGGHFCVLRYDTMGAPDVSFGSGGTVETPIGPLTDSARPVVIQPDNKIVLAGTCAPVGAPQLMFCAVRYNTDGTLDVTFGSAGKITTFVGSGDGFVTGIALQPDGRLVLAGYCNGAVYPSYCALRYSPHGALDITFRTNGTVVSSSGNS